MYYPVNYSVGDSTRLIALVNSAYDQYACFKAGKPWKIIAGYTAIAILDYPLVHKYGIDSASEKAAILQAQNKDSKDVRVPIGFVATDGANTFVAFRGTEIIREWVDDLKISLVPCFLPQYGKVHEGFSELYMTFNGALLTALKAHAAGNVYVAGHSLGAALATLAAIDIRENLKATLSAVYTYGSPRVGNDVFSAQYNAALGNKTCRMMNSSDLVPEIPPPVQFLGFIGSYFSHVDTPIVFNDQQNDLAKNHDVHTYIKAVTGA
jgi:triacylglycerol lipase